MNMLLVGNCKKMFRLLILSVALVISKSASVRGNMGISAAVPVDSALNSLLKSIEGFASLSRELAVATGRLISIEEELKLIGIILPDGKKFGLNVKGLAAELSRSLLEEMHTRVDEFSHVPSILKQREGIFVFLSRICGDLIGIHESEFPESLLVDLKDGKRFCELWISETAMLKKSYQIIQKNLSVIEEVGEEVEQEKFNQIISERRFIEKKTF